MGNDSLKMLVCEKVLSLFRSFDLKPSLHETECELLVGWVLEDIYAHPSCEKILHTPSETRHYLVQVALENIGNNKKTTKKKEN